MYAGAPRQAEKEVVVIFSDFKKKKKSYFCFSVQKVGTGAGARSQSLGALTTLLEDLGLSTSTRWLTTLWDSFLLKDYTSQLALRPEGGAMGGSVQQSFPSL